MKETIRKYILGTFMHGQESIDDDEELYESGLINSMGFVKLLAFVEETFDVPIDMSELTVDNFTTVNQMAEMISGKLEK